MILSNAVLAESQKQGLISQVDKFVTEQQRVQQLESLVLVALDEGDHYSAKGFIDMIDNYDNDSSSSSSSSSSTSTFAQKESKIKDISQNISHTNNSYNKHQQNRKGKTSQSSSGIAIVDKTSLGYYDFGPVKDKLSKQLQAQQSLLESDAVVETSINNRADQNESSISRSVSRVSTSISTSTSTSTSKSKSMPKPSFLEHFGSKTMYDFRAKFQKFETSETVMKSIQDQGLCVPIFASVIARSVSQSVDH